MNCLCCDLQASSGLVGSNENLLLLFDGQIEDGNKELECSMQKQNSNTRASEFFSNPQDSRMKWKHSDKFLRGKYGLTTTWR